MKKKYLFQLVQDMVMTAVLLSLFGYHLFEEVTHEWLGLGLLCLVILHITLNTWWLKKLFTGQYSGYRVFQTAVNFVTFLLFLTACISGILLSKHVFAEMPFHSTTDLMRKIHMTASHWLQIAIGVHLGLHWKALINLFAGNDRFNTPHPVSYVLSVLWLIIGAYGISAFFVRDLPPYLFFGVDFAFFDHNESKIGFYFDYFAILIAVAYATRIAVWALFFRTDK